MALEKSFVHLHVHCDGSALDGLALVADLVPAAEKLGMPAVAVTDHGSAAALYDLYKATKDSTVRPIYGIEAYLSPDVPRSHRSPVKWANGGEDDVSGGGAYTHATYLAETNQGLRNLFALSSESYLSGTYYKPRVDIELLEKYHEGIIATTGCPSGEVQTWLRIGDYEKAKAAAAKFMEIFGRDNYYVELMNHGLGIEKRVIPDLIRISKELRLPTVATNDLHYINKSDARFHEALLCISTRDRLSNPDRFKFDAEDFYLKTPHEMRAIWDTEVPDACDNTLVIAERCNATFVVEDRLMPKFPVPEGYTEHEWFEKEVWEGLKRRFPNGISPEHEARAKYEIGIINQLNFPSYFLVVADFINWAKDHGIGVGPGRGCLSGDSRVLTLTGFKFIKDVKVGDIVYDGEGNPVIVPAVFAYPCDEQLIEIVADNNAQGNKMTMDHRVLVSQDGLAPEWIRADGIKIGDIVFCPLIDNAGEEYSMTIAHSKFYTQNMVGYPVKTIQKVSPENFVYDFTVPTTHSYTTDSYVVHNSGAGSIVAYALRITELDPIANGLLFERFLNPERVSPPDIDVDFDDQRRGEVIEYCKQKYGEDKVVNIGTFMRIKAKAAIKDAARVLDEPYATGDKLTKVYPSPVAGEDMSLRDVYNPEHARYKEADEFRKLVASDPAFMKVLDIAKGLEGVKRGHGMHAAGVIMCSEPVINYVPLMKQDAEAPIMTQFEYPTCEKLGLIKMDFLGLSNLSTVNECLRLIKQNKGIDLTSADIWADMTDPATYKLLQGGETLGVFQLDSAPIRSLLRLMVPDRFDDISAVLALYRPGPMGANAHINYADRKNGRAPVVPIHPELEEPLKDILSDTWYEIVYQEQIMAIAQKVASYSLGQADLLRKAMGKKDKVIVDKEFKPFKEAALKNGYSEEAINKLWEVVVPFASYAFNRAHSAAYGYISYETAFLKANYPVEYMAALLSTNATNKDKTALYLGECRRMGIRVLAPDVNESFENYNAVGDDIRVGFIAIKGVGHGLVQSMIDARTEHGRFTGFGDFLSACPAPVLKKNAIEALIKAGGFDSFGYARRALVLIHDDAVAQALAVKKTQKAGQDSLFAGTGADPGSDLVVPDIAEWDRTTLLRFERDMLGLYVTDHPLNGFDHLLRKVAPMPIADVKESTAATGTEVKVAGLLSGIERRKTKAKGENWAILQVEDLGGSIVANAFPRTYRKYEDLLVEDTVVILEGKIEHRDDGSTSIVVNDIRTVDLAALADPDSVPFIVQVQEAQLSSDLLSELKDTLRMFAGPTPVQMRVVRLDGSVAILALGSEFGVRRGSPLVSGLKALLGVDCIIQS